MIYKQDGKTWTLPDALRFGSMWRGEYCLYTVEYRCPKEGEWYLSGAMIEAYRAKVDFITEYLVATPTDEAVKVTEWRRK